MFAWRCDRCNGYFLAPAHQLNIRSIVTLVPKDKNVIELKKDLGSDDEIKVDLCKKCVADITEEIWDPRRNMKGEGNKNE